MADDQVVLLDFWASPFGMRLRIALAEKDVKYEFKDQDVTNETRDNSCCSRIQFTRRSRLLFTKVNRSASPLLRSSTLTRFGTIGSTPLLPSDPYLRSQAKFWADFVDKKRGNFSIEPECPKFIAWVKRCLEKESVCKSLPDQDKVFDFVAEKRKKLGMDL
ncbi:hypothetical protein ACLB2K_023258 [Fragaria x ananassa]